MRDKKHTFSIDIVSKEHVKNISISNEAHDRVFFEGSLGQLVSLSLIQGCMLELQCTNGILRMSIDEDLLQKVLSNPKRVFSPSSEVGSYTSTKNERRK